MRSAQKAQPSIIRCALLQYFEAKVLVRGRRQCRGVSRPNGCGKCLHCPKPQLAERLPLSIHRRMQKGQRRWKQAHVCTQCIVSVVSGPCGACNHRVLLVLAKGSKSQGDDACCPVESSKITSTDQKIQII